jgi:hypothetical protein
VLFDKGEIDEKAKTVKKTFLIGSVGIVLFIFFIKLVFSTKIKNIYFIKLIFSTKRKNIYFIKLIFLTKRKNIFLIILAIFLEILVLLAVNHCKQQSINCQDLLEYKINFS